MTKSERHVKALEFFKDWSNYLLVTTVAALGWCSTQVTIDPAWVQKASVGLLAASSVFAIFTLGLIPLVAEHITDESTSIYDVTGRFRILWMWGGFVELRLKWVCWPQHVTFILAIALYGWAGFAGHISKVH